MTTWFEDPKKLVNSKNIYDFWPTKNNTPDQNVNATSRFIIYSVCILYLIRRDIRIVGVGVLALGVLYYMYRFNMINSGYTAKYINKDRPMFDIPVDHDSLPEDFLKNDINYGPQRSRSSLPEHMRNAYNRQFIPGAQDSNHEGQTHFAQSLYGGKTCREDPSLCDPNARGVQLEAFAGLDTNGDKRSGMMRGTVFS